jgi:DNA-directed RNA polymerase subunit F
MDTVSIDNQKILWADHLQSLLKSTTQRLNEIQNEISSTTNESMESLLTEKVQVQRQTEELFDLISLERESNCPGASYLPIYKSVVKVYIENDETADSILTGLSKRFSHQYLVLSVKCDGSSNWKSIKSRKDFDELISIFKAHFPQANKILPATMRKRGSILFSDTKIFDDDDLIQISSWLNVLVQDPVCSVHPELVKFLQPSSSKVDESESSFKKVTNIFQEASNMSLDVLTSAESVIKTAANTISASVSAEVLTDSSNLSINSKMISEEDLDIILDIIFTAIEELFLVKEQEQWMRQQGLHLVKALLRRLFGTQIAKAIAAKLDTASSQASIALAVKAVSHIMWPEGRPWGTNPPEVLKNAQENDRIKHQLFCLLTKQEGMEQSEEFRSAVGGIRNLVGKSNSQSGILRGFHMVQNQDLNIGLCCEILEQITMIVFNS